MNDFTMEKTESDIAVQSAEDAPFGRLSGTTDPSDEPAKSSQQLRIGDLEVQLEFTRTQIEELRNKLDTARVRHAEQLLNAQEASDRALDQAREDFADELARNGQLRSQLLTDAQNRFENELAAQSQRHETSIERERTAADRKVAEHARRADKRVEIVERRFAAEKRELLAQLAESDDADNDEDQLAMIAALRGEIATLHTDAAREVEVLQRKDADIRDLQRKIESANADHARVVENLTAEIERARETTAAERQRTALVREELLTECAALAKRAEDDVQVQGQALDLERMKLQEHLAEATERYRIALEGAENRLRIAAARETDLEASVLQLRTELQRSEQRPRH